MIRTKQAPYIDDDALLLKAALKATDRLDMTQSELAEVLGVSKSVVSRMSNQAGPLPASPKAREIVILFLRLYRALDAIVGGDDAVAARWLRADNLALGARPIEMIKSIAGLTATLGYLDARRALV